MIAVCALVAWIQPGPPDEPGTDPMLTAVAMTLGLAVIVLRGITRSKAIVPQTRVTLLMSAYACGFALAVLGAYVAINVEQPQTGVAFALAAFIICLRPPFSPSAPSPSTPADPPSA